jgi:hypothetical protein
MGPRRGSIPRLTDWLTVSRNVTLTWLYSVEYLHRDSASRRRRRKGKSQIWDSKIRSRVPRDSDPRMTALARASSNCKLQTRPFVREGAPHQQTRNCPTVIKIWSQAPDGCFIPRQTDRLTVDRNIRLRLRLIIFKGSLKSETVEYDRQRGRPTKTRP